VPDYAFLVELKAMTNVLCFIIGGILKMDARPKS